MKVALVHEALTVYGGAEKVLEILSNMFPDAPIYVPLYEKNAFPLPLSARDVRSTWLDRLPLAKRNNRILFPVYPMAMHGMDLSGYDLVISSSFNFAHNVSTAPETCHVSYCHSPARFLWNYNGYAAREGLGWATRAVVESMLPLLRAWDRAGAQGVDHWIATSRIVQNRVQKVYRMPSEIIPPPVDLSEFHVSEKTDDYYLLLMRLVGWKRPDIVVEACTRLGKRLIVAGEGRELEHLKSIAGSTVEFVGRVDGQVKADLCARCSALVLPSAEDFGITPLEAMASGRPVIAFRKGGALDTVVEGLTGTFFDQQTAESLMGVLETFDPGAYDPSAIRLHAETYDVKHFRKRILASVEAAIGRQNAAMHLPLNTVTPFRAAAE